MLTSAVFSDSSLHLTRQRKEHLELRFLALLRLRTTWPQPEPELARPNRAKAFFINVDIDDHLFLVSTSIEILLSEKRNLAGTAHLKNSLPAQTE